MECYVCGTPRPEGANYCPGCGRYCADDPNVRKNAPIPPEDMIMEPAAEAEPAVSETVSFPDLPDAPAINAEEPVKNPSPVKKRHRPVLIPVLIMAFLFLTGSVIWYTIPYAQTPEDGSAETTAPASKKPPLPSEKKEPSGALSSDAYIPTDESCFRIENGAVRFLPERYDGSPILVIPSVIDGQTVTSIADSGFFELEDVTTLILPDTLETIGDFAFSNCKKLRGVFIPDSVTSIGQGAFAGCIDMESVSIPEETVSIGPDAFYGCASLMYIFYEGTFDSWNALYDGYITPFTYACCSDGDYYHGVNLP